MMDRSHYPVRVLRPEQAGQDLDYAKFTPAERLAMVWELTRQAWMFKEGLVDEPRFRRDVVRIIRGQG
jgi:hypothetical protein